jgi:hypothetical protein
MEASQRERPARGGQISGWIAFAGVMMVILGTLDVLWGLAALFNNEVVVVGGHGVVIFDITTWGWVQLILGIVVALTGVGLLKGNSAARWLGVGLLGLNMILQIVWFPAAPLWALMIIVLDTVIIFQLCLAWNEE